MVFFPAAGAENAPGSVVCQVGTPGFFLEFSVEISGKRQDIFRYVQAFGSFFLCSEFRLGSMSGKGPINIPIGHPP